MAGYATVFLLVVSIGFIGKIANGDDDGDTELEVEPTQSPPLGAVALVECYSCVSCPNIRELTIKKTCPYLFDPIKAKKCVKYSEHYPHGKNISWVIRGCATERGSCEDIRKAYSNNSPDNVQLEYCTECEGDNCNNVSRSLPDMFFAFFAVVVAPIFAKYTLS